jgi:hypothetical protein
VRPRARPERQRDGERAPGSGAPGLDRLAAEAVARARRRAELVERARGEFADARALAERARGGPCCYCGVVVSYAGWHTGTAGGQCCGRCKDDRRDPIGLGAVDGDPAHRWRVLLRLLPELQGRWLPEYAMPRSRFAWWHETPGAPAGGAPFAYVDREQLRANLRPPAPAPLARREPCPRCGMADRWRREERPVRTELWDRPGPVPFGATPPELVETWTCTACQGWPESLDECAALAAGVKPYGSHLYGLAERLGVGWWADQPTRRARRAAAGPFAHWPPASVLKIRAARLLAGDPNAWPHDQARRDAETAAADAEGAWA